MISDLPLFRLYGSMAKHAAESQRVSAENIANADTPGYKATEIESFQDHLKRVALGEAADQSLDSFHLTESRGEANPNGNNVTLEREIFDSASAIGQHNLALTVYSKSIDLMRLALGRRG